MLVLGLDTSSPAVSAALVDLDSGRSVAESVVVDGRRHGELLAVGVRAVLAGTGRGELRAVVVGLGPGPFTGLRVGLVTAAALADALDLPVYGVCSLDAMVPEELADPAPGVTVVADARRREVYWASYALGRCVEGPAVGRSGELADHLRSLTPPPVLVGAGALLYREAFGGCPSSTSRSTREPTGWSGSPPSASAAARRPTRSPRCTCAAPTPRRQAFPSG